MRKFTDEEKRKAVEKWLELRPTMGNTRACREVGVQGEQLRLWAIKLGIEVPPVDRSVPLMIAKGRVNHLRNDDEWRRLIGEWIALRLEGMNSVKAGLAIGMGVSTLEHQARRLGVQIPDEVKRRGAGSVIVAMRKKTAQEKFELFLDLRQRVGSKAAAELVGRSETAMRLHALKVGVRLPSLRPGVKKGGV